MRVVITVLLAALTAVPTGTVYAQNKPEDRAEAERKRREDRDSERSSREAREATEILRDADDEIQELALASLSHVYPDRFLQEYVNELGQSLVPKEVPPGVLFSFRVIDEPLPNAFALPDGRIFVHSGLLAFVTNEAQLAMILGHEIGHVIERHYVESVKQQRRTALTSAIVGATAGAILGALGGGKKGAAEGAAAGIVAGIVVAQFRVNNYNRKQEDEADLIGTRLALDRNFDSKESLAFFDKLTDAFGEQDKFRNLLWGRHSRNKERAAHIKSMMESGDLFDRYNKARTAGDLTVGSGELPRFASRMKRDTAIRLMDEYDRYGDAKKLLEEIEQHRPRDPRTLWALGRVYKLVARTPSDRAKALDYLQRAVQSDERNLFAVAHRDLGLMQARLEQTAAASESLKRYVRTYVTQRGSYPPDLEEVYDYLLTFGDGTWTAPPIDGSLVRAAFTPAPAPRQTEPVSPPAAPKPPDPKKAVTPNVPASKPAPKAPPTKP